MKKIFLLLLMVSLVSAQNVVREFSESSPTERIYLYNYPYWIEPNTTATVYVTPFANFSNESAEFIIYNGNASTTYNMSKDVSKSMFTISLTNANRDEDSNFTVNIFYNETAYTNSTSDYNNTIINLSLSAPVDYMGGYELQPLYQVDLQGVWVVIGIGTRADKCYVYNATTLLRTWDVNASSGYCSGTEIRLNTTDLYRVIAGRDGAVFTMNFTNTVSFPYNRSAVNITKSWYLDLPATWTASTAQAYNIYALQFHNETVSSTDEVIATANDTLRFRTPHTVTLDFFQNNAYTTTSLTPYDNEFQYALLKYRVPGTPIISYLLPDGGAMSASIMDALGSLVPYYESVSAPASYVYSQEIYLFAPLVSGVAEIEVYELGNYTLYTFDADNPSASADSFYEFGLPRLVPGIDFRSSKIKDFPVENLTIAPSYSVFVSGWRVYKWHLMKNLLFVLLSLGVWGAFIVGFCYLLTSWIPNPDIQTKAFSALLITLGLASSPLLIMVVRFVWT